MRDRRESERNHRVAGALFFLGAVCMLFNGVKEQEPLFFSSMGMQLVAWLLFVTHANRLAGHGGSASAREGPGQDRSRAAR